MGDAKAGIPADRPVIYAWIVILSTIAVLFVTTAIGSRRWRNTEVGDGDSPLRPTLVAGPTDPAVRS